MPPVLRSARAKPRDVVEAIELCYERGWTDGLPVVPPTEDRVREFLDHAGVDPRTVVGVVAERARPITVEKVAINAVMAGCLPSYLPVVLAAVEAMCSPEYNLHGTAASTGGPAPLLILSGPVVKELGVNTGANVLGGGSRANATIGRAVNLVIRNVCGGAAGILDMSTIGHPGKITYCLGESAEDNPWEPFHVSQGLSAEQSAVTVLAADPPQFVNNHFSHRTEELLCAFADAIARSGIVGGAIARSGIVRGGALVVVLSPEHAAVIRRDGWSRQQVAEFLVERASRSTADLKQARAGWVPFEPGPGDEGQRVHALSSPDALLMTFAGGKAGGFSAIICPWGLGVGSRPVTRPVG